MSWYGNGFHIIAPFVKEFHNTLVDSPHRGPVMQIFFLFPLLLAWTSCWINSSAAGDLRGCVTVKWHINVTSWYYCKIYFFAILYIFPSEYTHVTKPTFSFSISFLLDFNSCCIFVFIWSLMFSHLVCWTKWWMNYWGEVCWSDAGWAAAGSPPDTWYFLVQPLVCPISTPSDCG